MNRRRIIAIGDEVYIRAHQTERSAPSAAHPRTETMKIMLRAAMFALSISNIAPAFAGDGGPTDHPPQAWIAQGPVQTALSVATAQNGEAVHTYVTQSNHGTWLYAPAQNGNN